MHTGLSYFMMFNYTTSIDIQVVIYFGIILLQIQLTSLNSLSQCRNALESYTFVIFLLETNSLGLGIFDIGFDLIGWLR